MRWLSGLFFLAASTLLFGAEEMVVTGSRLNIRKSPSVKGAVIGSVKAGDRVRIRSIRQGWAELDGRPGFVSATYLRKAAAAPARGKAPAAPAAGRKAAAAVKLPPGQAFPDLAVIPGSKKDVTVSGLVFPIKAMGRVRYALLRNTGKKYVPQCYIYVPDKDAAKFRDVANTEVELVGYWYRVNGWKMPVIKARRIRTR